MALILRKDKGQKLTIDDLDGNFEYLESISGGTSSTIDISLTKDVLGGYITDGEKTFSFTTFFTHFHILYIKIFIFPPWCF